jgi:hypothetical protein
VYKFNIRGRRTLFNGEFFPRTDFLIGFGTFY